jgi:heme-degrading monooxygenase HmoA
MIAGPAGAVGVSTVDSVFRAVLQMQIHPGLEVEFERVWLELDRHLAGDPGSLQRSLLRSATEDGVYFLVSDWVNEAAFRAFENGPVHLALGTRLHPYRAAASSSAMYLVHQVTGRVASTVPLEIIG